MGLNFFQYYHFLLTCRKHQVCLSVVVVVVVVVVVLTLTCRYNAVRGHRKGPNSSEAESYLRRTTNTNRR